MKKEIRLKRNGQPYGTIQAAKTGAMHLKKNEGLDSTPVPVEGGLGLEVMVPDDHKTKAPKPERVPIASRDILTIPPRHGYKRRCVNINEDKAGWARIERFQEAGYSIIEGDVEIGNKRIAAASQMGSAAIRPVGGGMKGIWMEIREDWYAEDQDTKQMKINETESSMVVNEQNPGDGMYGKVDINSPG